MVIKFRVATKDDVAPLVSLVNAAYRPTPEQAGWTHEGHLLEGARINATQLYATLDQANSIVLLGADAAGAVVACVHVEKQGEAAYVGMLTVAPGMQTVGHGKAMLAFAEEYAVEVMDATSCVMTVISSRHELIDFYLRRGYVRTGDVSDFPVDAGVGTSKVGRITFDKLAKVL